MWMWTWEFACSDARAGPTPKLASASQAATGYRPTNTSTKTLPRTSVYSNALSILAVSGIRPLARANLNVQSACWQTHPLFSACSLVLTVIMRTT